MLRHAIILLCTTAVLGCQLLDKARTEEVAARPIGYFDSPIFDAGLNAALDREQEEIIVTVPPQTSVKDMPERLEKWLVNLSGKDGHVELAQTEPPFGASRSIAVLGITAADLLKEGMEYLREAHMYSAVEGYDAVITYDHLGIIQQVKFKRRPE